MGTSAPLDVSTIHQAIEEVCLEQTDKDSSWEFVRASTQEDYGGTATVELSLLFGVVARLKVGESSAAGTKPQTASATFYLAYSTWDGRMLNLDKVTLNNEDAAHRASVELLLRQTVAKIAVALGCSRFTWHHYDKNLTYSVTPETMHGWLTLHWNADKMKSFLGDDAPIEPPLPPLPDSTGIQMDYVQVIQKCLLAASKDSPNGELKLRLASGNDVGEIGRLVQGLADYEKEPDAVNVTEKQYQMDGFGEKPLYYCVLLDHTSSSEQGQVTTKTMGMAFFYVGARLDEGRFVYLEDLFIEETYRGRGSGSLVMRALALVGLGLNCSRLVWQALDWNTPALTFYNKIGAAVQEGLTTTRFTGPSLVDFCAAH